MMFTGVTSHHSAGQVRCYADARRELERCSKTPTGRQRTAKSNGFPLGQHSRGVTWVRELPDRSIAFKLYSTDAVTWHPDDSVTIEGYASKTTAGFAFCFLPNGVSLSSDGTARYVVATDNPSDDWRTWRDRHRVCRYDVTLRKEGELWLPDEDTLEPITFLDLDRKVARTVSREHNLPDFGMWLSMAPMHMSLEHEHENYDAVARALLARDWRTAAVHLPLVHESRAFGNRVNPLPIATRGWAHVTMTSVRRFRDWLYDCEGCSTRVSAKTWSYPEFGRRMKRLKDLERAGVYPCGVGV